MSDGFEQIYQDVCAWAEAQGVRVSDRHLPAGKAGEFDGLTATMNDDYPAEQRVYYLAHALGSVVRWSLNRDAVQGLFDELRSAKKAGDTSRLERAIAGYRAFEAESSEFAVWMLAHLGHASSIPSYTNFMRADLEALTQFHRQDKAPVWRQFFARWNDDVKQGRREAGPFEPKPIPPFVPLRIDKQEILQEQGDGR